MFSPSSDIMRIDPLTGCRNFLGFLESCMVPAVEGSADDLPTLRKTTPNLLINAFQYSAVLFVSMCDIRFLNETKGFAHGDSAIRWMGILLQEETNQLVYRVTGTEFAVFLKMESDPEHNHLLERILKRMNQEAELLGFPGAPADVALILNDQPSPCLDNLLMQMGEAMVRVKNCGNAHYMVFHAGDFEIPASSPKDWRPAGKSDISYAIRWIARTSIYRVIDLGKTLDRAHQEAYTDLISNLPNMRAALVHLEEMLQSARAKSKPFSILLIDGDNLRAFNAINYATGDEMIRQMGIIFKQNLRPDDFVARWRTGDEFLVILPDTTGEAAVHVGERFRMAVKSASQAWRFPATISTGVSSYPTNGEDLSALVEMAEAANKRAKDQGKDQVVLAG